MHDLVARRERWCPELSSVRQLHAQVLAAEHILSGAALRETGLPVTNATVGQHFDAWCMRLQNQLNATTLPTTERRCLEHFLHVTGNMRPQLIRCYDLDGLPRTNNDMEGFIRSIKTRYRRISGRKNWNRYLLRYGRRVVYYEASVRMGTEVSAIGAGVQQVPHAVWRTARAEQYACQEEQLKQYRFRHRRARFLTGLEVRWAATTQCTGLLP